MARERRIIAIFGAQGTGKTTLAKALFGNAMRRGERVYILSPAAIGGYPLPEDPAEAVQARLEQRGSMTMLVADDADRYVPKVPPKGSPWRRLALTNRHEDIDLLFTARRPQELPDVLLSGVDFLYVFQSSAADVNGRKRLLDIAPGIQFPSKPYEFVRFEPKTASGNPRTGRVLKAGGVRMDG